MMYSVSGIFQVMATGTGPITYSLSGEPAGVSIDATTGLMTIAPTTLVGTYTFAITASNAAGTATTNDTVLNAMVDVDATGWFTGLPAGITVANNANARFNITEPQPSSNIPKTGDGFPIALLIVLMSALLAGLGWLGYRMRKEKRT